MGTLPARNGPFIGSLAQSLLFNQKWRSVMLEGWFCELRGGLQLMPLQGQKALAARYARSLLFPRGIER